MFLSNVFPCFFRPLNKNMPFYFFLPLSHQKVVFLFLNIPGWRFMFLLLYSRSRLQCLWYKCNSPACSTNQPHPLRTNSCLLRLWALWTHRKARPAHRLAAHILISCTNMNSARPEAASWRKALPQWGQWLCFTACSWDSWHTQLCLAALPTSPLPAPAREAVGMISKSWGHLRRKENHPLQSLTVTNCGHYGGT